MLIEFSVKNYCSIRDTQTLSMVASNKDKSLPGNLIEVDAPGMGDLKLLKSAVVYGANASGKSNLFLAVCFMRHFVVDSATDLTAGDPTGVQSFRLDLESEKSPSEFEVLFLHEGVRYQYGFSLDRTRIHEEWLFAYPGGREQRWYERSLNTKTGEYDWFFSRYFKGQKKSIKANTRENALFMSVGAQLNHKQLVTVHGWFREHFRFLNFSQIGSPAAHAFTAEMIDKDKDVRRLLVEFLRQADLGIADVQVRRLTLDDVGMTKFLSDEAKNLLKENPLAQIYFVHKVKDRRQTVAFEERVESTGTQKFFALLGPWLGMLGGGYTLLVDEIGANMHPLLVRKLVRATHDSEINAKDAQLLLTTHDTTLLDTSLFRRDQVWFTEKDRDGATDLYPLTDYKPRNTEALQKGYLAGRYGAIPFLGDFSFGE